MEKVERLKNLVGRLKGEISPERASEEAKGVMDLWMETLSEQSYSVGELSDVRSFIDQLIFVSQADIDRLIQPIISINDSEINLLLFANSKRNTRLAFKAAFDRLLSLFLDYKTSSGLRLKELETLVKGRQL